jgi:hypothetical protein
MPRVTYPGTGRRPVPKLTKTSTRTTKPKGESYLDRLRVWMDQVRARQAGERRPGYENIDLTPGTNRYPGGGASFPPAYQSQKATARQGPAYRPTAESQDYTRTNPYVPSGNTVSRRAAHYRQFAIKGRMPNIIQEPTIAPQPSGGGGYDPGYYGYGGGGGGGGGGRGYTGSSQFYGADQGGGRYYTPQKQAPRWLQSIANWSKFGE